MKESEGFADRNRGGKSMMWNLYYRHRDSDKQERRNCVGGLFVLLKFKYSL